MIQSISSPWGNSCASATATPITHHSSLYKSLAKKNSSGITLEDFSDFTDKTGLSKSESAELFKKIDTSGDGVISAAEMKRGFTAIADSLFDHYQSTKGSLANLDLKAMAKDLGLDADKFTSKINPNDEADVSRAEFERNMRAVLNHFDRYKEKEGDAPPAASADYKKGYRVQIKETIKQSLTYKRTSAAASSTPAATTEAPATSAPAAEAQPEGDNFSLEFSASIEETISYVPNEGPLPTSAQKPSASQSQFAKLGLPTSDILTFLHSLINPKRIMALLGDPSSSDPNNPSGGSTSGSSNGSGNSSAANSTNPAMSYSEQLSASIAYKGGSGLFSLSDVINSRWSVVG